MHAKHRHTHRHTQTQADNQAEQTSWFGENAVVAVNLRLAVLVLVIVPLALWEVVLLVVRVEMVVGVCIVDRGSRGINGIGW